MRLLEYLALLPKGLANPGKVLEGIYNEVRIHTGTLSEPQLKEVIRRRVICEGCPFMSRNANTSKEYFEMVGEHYKSDRHEKHCASCKCPLITKTASLSSDCGLTVLNSKYPDKQQELKWTKYQN